MGDESLPPVPDGLVVAGIGKAGLFLHRQRVEFGAHHDGGAVAVLVDRDQPGLADFLGDLEADRAHFGGEFCGGLHLLKSDFGMGVDVLVERVEFWIVAFDRCLDGALQPAHVEFGMGRQRKQAAHRNGGEQRSDKMHHRIALRFSATYRRSAHFAQHVLLHLAAVEMEERHRRVVAQRTGGEAAFEFGEHVPGHGVQIGERL